MVTTVQMFAKILMNVLMNRVLVLHLAKINPVATVASVQLAIRSQVKVQRLNFNRFSMTFQVYNL